MITSRLLAPFPMLLIGLALCAALVLIPWVVQAQSQGVTPTAAATGDSPPAKPTNLQASAVHDSVTLTWTASTDQTVTHYAILRRNPDTDPSQVFHVIESNAGAETSYTDGSVSASSTYIYRVKSVSPTGVSQWSGYVKAETPAAPDTTPTSTLTPTPSPEPVSTPAPEDLRPTGLTVSLVENKVTLSWSTPKEDAESVDGYEILRRRPMEGETTLKTLVADTESTATTYTDATANEAGVVYVYRVKALRGDDVSLWSNFDRITLPADYVLDPTPTPETESTPDDLAPTGLSAALAEGGGVVLSWDAPVEDADSVTGYEILRAVGGAGFTTLVDDTGSTATFYTDATATEAGETYAYQVKAIRGEDRSQASGQAQVQVPHDPVDLAPTGLTALVMPASVVGGQEFTTRVGLTWSAPAEDADTITGYEILRAVGGGEFTTLVDDTGSTATFYTDATATEAGETYAYQVKAIRGEDRSQASGQAEVRLPHDAVDQAPTGLTATLAEGGGMTLSWSAPVEDAGSVTGYEVLRAVGEGEMAILVADTASTTTTYSDATATKAGETYTYQVKAIRDGVRSQASAAASAARPAAIIVATCEFDAGGSDLPPDTSTACAIEVGGSVRGERGAADDVDWYRVGLQAHATYQFDMRGKSTGEWQLVDGVPAFVSVGTLEDPKLLGIYDASGVLVPGTDSEVAGTGKDSRIASFSPAAADVYYISASAESAWTGTYELSLAVTAGEHVDGLTLLAPSGLEVSMVRNRLTLIWTAPAADAESVTGYEILRGVGQSELATLVADTGSTSTTHTDTTATEAGARYTYGVKALRSGEASVVSDQASYDLPDDYISTTKESASKAFVPFDVAAATVMLGAENVEKSDSGNTVKFVAGNTAKFVVQPDNDPEEPFTIWSGQLTLGLFSNFQVGGVGALVPNTFTYNGVDYTITAVGLNDGNDYIPGTSDYEQDLLFIINPAIGEANIAAWKFVTPDGEFAFADAIEDAIESVNHPRRQYKWPSSRLDWSTRGSNPFQVSITGPPGTDGQEPVVDTTPGIKLSWKTRTRLGFQGLQFDSNEGWLHDPSLTAQPVGELRLRGPTGRRGAQVRHHRVRRRAVVP